MRARLDFTHADRIARLTLAAPKANILDAAMIAELNAACMLLAERRNLTAVVISGEGPNFSFGASVEEHLPDCIEQTLAALHRLLRRLAALPAPTIAAVRGQCLGGGFEVALACDLIIAERDARLGCPEIRLGVFPPAASVLLPVRVGVARATQLVLTGAPISGEQAFDAGLVARLADTGSLDAAVDDWLAGQFLQSSAAALRIAAHSVRGRVHEALDVPLGHAERLYLDELMKQPDAEEGIRAFLERRPARWHAGAVGT
jgi:cyclohexa-1,5-dienecarbonyl-CoA hydratase